jgi:hypothetical protein
MSSDFDSLFADESTPELMNSFGVAISVIARTGESGTTTYSPTAQIGREQVRRVRTTDGMKVLRTREVIVSLDADDGLTPLPESALQTLAFATVSSVKYIIAGYDPSPGRQVRLTLERSDAADVSRPNMKKRR